MAAIDLFGPKTTSIYVVYNAQIQIRDVIVGGIPSDPSITRKWLEARLDLGDPILEEVFAETIRSRDVPMTITEKVDALMGSGDAPSVNGFKRDFETGHLAYEARCLKGALKEWANSAYPGVDWPGKNKVAKGFRKGLESTLAERVFVDPTLISLGVTEPTRSEERVKHLDTPKGRISALSRVDVIEAPLLSFTVTVRRSFDEVLRAEGIWPVLWQVGEEIGIGSDRGRSDGRFNLVQWQEYKVD